MATKEMPSRDELESQMPSNSWKSQDNPQPKTVNKNSAKADIPENKKQVRQVAKAKVRKQGFLKKFGKSIIEDGIETAKERAYNDIIVPGFKSLIFDTITDMLDSMLFGSEGGSRGSQRRSERLRRNDRTSYSDYYSRSSRRDHREEREEQLHEPDQIILDTRGEARDVLEELDYTIQKYGQASILDFYDIVGVSGDWTDKRYGWTSLRTASVKPVRDGFEIVLPRARLLED